jgi:peptidoglycan-N-acetylglucosamine deacetylase
LFVIPSEQVFAAGKSQLISKGNTSQKMMALTFDDGSDGENLQKIIDILDENEIHATFFLTGQAAKAHSKQIKNLLANGNTIGNHSYSHPQFTKLSVSKMEKELMQAEKTIVKITGQSTKPYFRPPYGDYNSSVLKTVDKAGYTKSITWTIDTLDWKGLSANTITKKVLKQASPGAIVLLHAGGGAVNTPAALPDIIKGLKKKGYQLVTIPELLKDTPVKDIENNDSQLPDTEPALTRYIVNKGDTLTKIANKYNVTVKELAVTNHITNVNLIYTNQVLIIPY